MGWGEPKGFKDLSRPNHWPSSQIYDLMHEVERLNGLLAEEARVCGLMHHGGGKSGYSFFWNAKEERWQGVDERDNAPN